MTIKEEDIDQLDRYHSGELDEAEAKVISDRLQTDADFQQTAKLYKDVVTGIEHRGSASLKERLNAFHEETNQHSL
ncbi:MAG: hypothetical protein HRT70_08800, partial [Flavobacteriaceae bacterium]|nr:hypothetical protein [Flavobacteriaceae bacterium]